MVESGKDIKDFVLNDRVPKEGKETDGLLLFKNLHHLFPLQLKRDGSATERERVSSEPHVKENQGYMYM